MPGLTVHTMIRNEPFVYYAVKSVYKYVDKILLTDTGSDDPITLDGIQRLLDEDIEKKISFQFTPIKDMTRWINTGTNIFSERCKALSEIWNKQIAETETEFFLIVDGDEVHYEAGIKQIVEEVLPKQFINKDVCFLPILWFVQLDQVLSLSVAPSRLHGRIFCTNNTVVKVFGAKGEMHCDKKTGKVFLKNSQNTFNAEIPAFAHFSIYLKPFNHIVTKGVRRFRGSLPEVMVEDDSFIKRYQESLLKKE